MRNRFVTNAYKSKAPMIKGIRRITTKAVRVEIFAGDRIDTALLETLYWEAV